VVVKLTVVAESKADASEVVSEFLEDVCEPPVLQGWVVAVE
jgi:hypothetical protein